MATAEFDIEEVLVQVNIPATSSIDIALESDEVGHLTNITVSQRDRSHTAVVMDTDKGF